MGNGSGGQSVKKVEIGVNVAAHMKGKTLVLEIDTEDEGRPSKSGKNMTIATTEGNVLVPMAGATFKLGINAFRKPD